MNKITKIKVQKNKKKIQKKSILIHFDYEKSVIINADASEKAMRAWLQQIDNQEQKQLIACYAQKLTLTKQWYDVHDRKMLAIIEVLEWWRAYLQEAKHQTIIKLNHKNLQYFMTMKKLNEWQTQWTETLMKYDFIIQHCKKKNNSWADILSRRSDFVKEKVKKKNRQCYKQIKKNN